MTMTTRHLGIARSGPRSVARTSAANGFAGAVGLIVIGAIVALVGAAAPAIALALLVVAMGGSVDATAQAVSLAAPFIAVTGPITAVWLLGAVQTGRTIRRLAVVHDRADRAAFAELNALLARE